MNVLCTQCENGHMVCASCCTSYSKKCPSCFLGIGKIRCRGVERILESITVDCENREHGCWEQICYANNLGHRKTCKYVPCHCPHPSCNYIGPCEPLYEHFLDSHSVGQYFRFGSRFTLSLDKTQDHVFLQETNKHVVFVLTRSGTCHGNIVNIVCIAPASYGTSKYSFELTATKAPRGIRVKAPVECILEWTEEFPDKEYLVVPCDFVGVSEQLRMQIIIRNLEE